MSSDEIYNELLAVRCQLGERGALAELVDRWEQPLYYYVRRMLPAEDDALQVLQDVWLRVCKDITGLREPRKLVPWLYTLTRRAIADHLRSKYGRSARVDAEPADEKPIPVEDEGANWFVAAEEVHFGLSRVSVVEREVLTLYFLQDLSIEEIAAVLGIAPGTVKSRLFQARAALRAALTRSKGEARE